MRTSAQAFTVPVPLLVGTAVSIYRFLLTLTQSRLTRYRKHGSQCRDCYTGVSRHRPSVCGSPVLLSIID